MKRLGIFFAAMTVALSPLLAADIAPDEVIVKFRRGVPRPVLAFQSAPLKTFGIGRATERARRFTDAMEDFAVIRLSPGTSVEDAIRALRSRPDVEYAGPNPIARAMAAPNDSLYATQQWGFNNTGQVVNGNAGVPDADIDAAEAWNIVTGDSDVIVAVVDSGVDYLHPDLNASMWRNPGETPGNGLDDDSNGIIDDYYGANFIRASGPPTGDPNTDGYFHGTHVAGIIGAVTNNAAGIAGTCWAVKVMALRFLDSSGNGTVANGTEAIQYAVANGASVINNSWATSANDPLLSAAVSAATAAGVVVVGSAGNDVNGNTVYYPGAYGTAVSVSATTNQDGVLTLNRGLHIDLGAPGKDVASTMPSGLYALATGTSMSAPHVSGVAALMKSLDATILPGEVLAILKASADAPAAFQAASTTTTWYGHGRLNAFNAVRSVGDGEAPAVSLTAPAPGSTVNGAVTLSATASDDAVLMKVWFLVDGVVVSTDTASPYSASWDSTLASDGAHVVTARAFDGAGNSADSSIGVSVGNGDVILPSVALISPTNGSSISGNVNVSASASDNTGVSKVRFALDGVVRSTDSTAAYEWSFDTTASPDGVHTLTAYAFDTIGNSTFTSISVTIDNPDISSPTVTMTSPAAGAQLHGSFLASATAADDTGVTSVEFLVDGVVAGTDFSAPFAATLDTLVYSTGTRSLAARASDAAGNVSSHTITVLFRETPVDTAAPVVSIPGLGAGTRLNGIVQLAVAASDDVGVVRVDLFVDGGLIESDVAAPFSFTVDTPALGAGAHVITMKAYDAEGNEGATSLGVSVGGYSIGAFHPLFNPMKGETVVIPLNLGEPLHVQARLMDRFGALVADLANAQFSPGASLSWDGRTASGDVAASGVYVLYLNIGGSIETRKIVLRK